MNYKIFQYVPMSKPKALSKMVPKIINNSCASIVLDIEDSVQDTLSPENTSLLKENARQSIPILIDELLRKDFELADKLYVRVNSLESGELEKDINLLKKVILKVNEIGIFLPMVRNISDLYTTRKFFGQDFSKVKIVPIIETVDGYNNIQQIINSHNEFNIEYLHYGHYDYSLDSCQWPFIEQNESAFWSFINNFIKIVEKNNLKYMHTPFGNLADEKLYKSIVKTLLGKCKNDFAVTALNYNQSLFAQDVTNVKEVKFIPIKVEDKQALAEEVISIFENNQCSKRSFSVDIKKAKFLTPHEYRMALKYLEKVKKNGRD